MKLWILSDLHREFVRFRAPIPEQWPEHDVVILAGDISQPAAEAVSWGENVFEKPVILVLGNHEHYGQILKDNIEEAKAAAVGTNVHLLENRSVKIGNVRFLGCTLWSDFGLYGRDHAYRYMKAAKLGLNDFQQISFERERPDWMPTRFTPAHSLALHQESRAWLEANLPRASSDMSDNKIVVVTHNAPHENSHHVRFWGDQISPAFVNHLPEIFEQHRVDLWVHGHVHDSMDYVVGRTRIIANPRGYGSENRAFRWDFVVEV